jgi:hypothetical protein
MRRDGLTRRLNSGWLSPGQAGRQVGGERGEVAVGPRRQYLPDPQVELVPGQPPLHERGLKGVDHLLAVGVRRSQVAAASCTCYLVTRCCHAAPLPYGRNAYEA